MKLRRKAISMVLIVSLLMAVMIQPLSTSAGELGTSSAQPEVQEGAFTPIQDGTLCTVDHYCTKEYVAEWEEEPNSPPCQNITCDKCVLKREEVRRCIMGARLENFYEFTDEDIYCSDCRNKINNYFK